MAIPGNSCCWPRLKVCVKANRIGNYLKRLLWSGSFWGCRYPTHENEATTASNILLAKDNQSMRENDAYDVCFYSYVATYTRPFSFFFSVRFIQDMEHTFFHTSLFFKNSKICRRLKTVPASVFCFLFFRKPLHVGSCLFLLTFLS